MDLAEQAVTIIQAGCPVNTVADMGSADMRVKPLSRVYLPDVVLGEDFADVLGTPTSLPAVVEWYERLAARPAFVTILTC